MIRDRIKRRYKQGHNKQNVHWIDVSEKLVKVKLEEEMAEDIKEWRLRISIPETAYSGKRVG